MGTKSMGVARGRTRISPLLKASVELTSRERKETIFVTGSAGFIGFHVSKRLLALGHRVVGIDNMNDYYDPKLKYDRNALLQKEANYTFYKSDICDWQHLQKIFSENKIDKICHMAAQAGVRYSLTHPFAYQKSNGEGFLNVLEMARQTKVQNFVFASSSSVYGGNTKIPFSEGDRVDAPVSLYAATKRANELIAHSYTHLYKLPCTGLRFFTVYGPWGRPDMAYFKFAELISQGKPIEIYNHGKMKRDFTYIDDAVDGVVAALEKPSSFEIFNLGNSQPEELSTLIALVEKSMGTTAKKTFTDMQAGDVVATFADIEKSKRELGFDPKTKLEDGILKFVEWFKGRRIYYTTV